MNSRKYRSWFIVSIFFSFSPAKHFSAFSAEPNIFIYVQYFQSGALYSDGRLLNLPTNILLGKQTDTLRNFSEVSMTKKKTFITMTLGRQRRKDIFCSFLQFHLFQRPRQRLGPTCWLIFFFFFERW